MLPMSPTHALAIARDEEVQRETTPSWLREPAPAHTAWLVSALSALTHPLRHEATGATRTESGSSAVCCA